MCRLELILCLFDSGLRAGHIGVGRGQAAACVDGGNGHGDIGSGCVGLRAGQLSLGVLDCDLIVRGVQFGDKVALLYHLVLCHIDLQNLAADARTDLNQVPVDLRVVGILAECPVPPHRDRDRRQNHHHDHNDGPAAGRRLGDLCIIVRLQLTWSLS